MAADQKDSKNWETTQNIYIEGDNLDTLKLLQREYYNKIKMIYIDPPYNTEKKFIYKDTFDIETIANRTQSMRDLFDNCSVFDYPKPVELVKRMLQLCTGEEDIILDFFSGSSTTAHAVMQLNAEDGGNRKFIMVQLPEPCDEKSETYKAGCENICEIGKERIRRAGEKIKLDFKESDNIANLDVGFRVYRVCNKA